MARIRTIKPEFWSDETITECSLSARLLFIGIWNFADDFGNIEASAKQLKMKIFPADDIKIEPLLCELLTHGLLREYTVSTHKYLNVKGFKKHQIINRPSRSKFPPFDESLQTHGLLTEHSHLEGKGREKEGKRKGVKTEALVVSENDSQPKNKKSNGKLTDEEWLQAVKTNPAYGGIDIDRELAKMDAWLSTPKARGRKKTRAFILNWLNKIDKPMAQEDGWKDW